MTVTPVNDAPTLAAVSGVSFDEDGSGSTTLAGSDIDSADLTYSISGGTDITATVDGSTVSFTAASNFNGSENFTATVTDGEFSASQAFSVTVAPVNDAPTANAASGTVAEDGSVVITLTGNDIDGDIITFSVADSAVNGSVSIGGSLAIYTPSANFSGDDSFTFTASDGDLSDTATVTLTVTAVNDAPTLASVDAVSFDEDGSGATTL